MRIHRFLIPVCPIIHFHNRVQYARYLTYLTLRAACAWLACNTMETEPELLLASSYGTRVVPRPPPHTPGLIIFPHVNLLSPLSCLLYIPREAPQVDDQAYLHTGDYLVLRDIVRRWRCKSGKSFEQRLRKGLVQRAVLG